MPATINLKLTARLAQLKAALSRRDRVATNRAVVTLLDEQAPIGEHWKTISHLMQVSGEYTLALRAIDAFIASAANPAMARYSKVVLLTQAHRQQDAHDLLIQLPENVPDRAGHAYVLGNIALTLGHSDAARGHLLNALEHRPGWGPAWLSLASTGNLAEDRMAEQMLAEAAAAERQGPADLARYCYARGKLHADRKDPAAAFSAYLRGAALLKSETPYSRDANAANALSAMTGFDAEFFKRMQTHATADTDRPIFVTGLPRSGTTLVEHILASHSQVHDGGELNVIQHVAVTAGGVSGHAIDQYLAGGGTLIALGDLYLHLLTERAGSAGRIVDKTIDASRYLGLIATIFPNVPLIWMQRDPLDNAWSCFRTFFIHGVGWSFDLDDIAHHFELEAKLMAFWKRRLGDRLLIVPFADMVGKPALWTSNIISHCGLGEEDAVHTPHLTKRRVSTASGLQVRRPINTDGLGVAEPYRSFLRPFTDAIANCTGPIDARGSI
jgi:tetratricopeptide (TPR) repeat protein